MKNVKSTMQFKRGKKNELPNGLEGEPLYCTDTNELYIGQGEGHAPKLINANGTGGETTEDIKEYMEKVDDLEKNKINLIDDDTSMEGIDDTEFPTLTTKDKKLIGAINEVNSQCKGIANYGLTIGEDGKAYLMNEKGVKFGTGIKFPSDVDLSKITMSMDGQTLKLLNNGTQIATVEIPTAVVTDEQLTNIIQSKIDDGTLNSATITDKSVTLNKLGDDVVTKAVTDEDILEIFTPVSFEGKSLNGNTGEEISIANRIVTDYIDISNNKIYRLPDDIYTKINGNPFLICFYDENKTFLSNKYFSQGQIYKEGATYFRLTGSKEDYNTKGKFYHITKRSYNKFNNDIVLPNFDTGKIVNKKLTFTSNDILLNKSANTSDICADNNTTNLVKPVKVIPGETYKFFPFMAGNTRGTMVVFMDISKTKYSQQWVNESVGKVTIPDNFQYISWAYENTISVDKVYIEGNFKDYEHYTNDKLVLQESNFSSDVLMKLRKLLGLGAGGNLLYNALDYNISTSSEDNTPAMQTLIDTVNSNGGGIIYLPVGTYKFKTSGTALNAMNESALVAKSNVSIIGESLTGTIIKMIGKTNSGYTWLGYYNSATPIEGCTYSNFTVDAEECTITTYSHRGKAFFYHNVKNCVWRDLILRKTPATALGIDMLDNVVIDSIYCDNCGREWSTGGEGGAGIGIGTGLYTNENYVIRNCICVNCGHYGIFLEDQGRFDSSYTYKHSKGASIVNNIVRGTKNYGIGLRGGKNIIIANNQTYENMNGGIYLDYGCHDVDINNNLVIDNTGDGILIETSMGNQNVNNILIQSNHIQGNGVGIDMKSPTANMKYFNNVLHGNTTGIKTSTGQSNTIIKNNLLLDNANNINTAHFIDDTTKNDLIAG